MRKSFNILNRLKNIVFQTEIFRNIERFICTYLCASIALLDGVLQKNIFKFNLLYPFTLLQLKLLM